MLGFALVVLLFLLYYPWIIIVPQAIYSRINPQTLHVAHAKEMQLLKERRRVCMPIQVSCDGGGR